MEKVATCELDFFPSRSKGEGNADFALFSFCRSSCGKSNAGKVDPSFRARICGACLKKDFIDPYADESKEKMKQFNEFARYFVEKKAHEASKLHNTFDTFFFSRS